MSSRTRRSSRSGCAWTGSSTGSSPAKIIQDALISRIKIMANLDIAEKRLPQDGRIRLLIGGA